MRRKQLGAQLSALREAVGVTTQEAADLLGCSEAKVRHMESGRNAPRKPDLMILLQFYKAPDDAYEVLEELRREASKRGWWSTYKLPPWLQSYVGLEADAATMKAFEVELIPGLLQTEDYARQVHLAADPTASTTAQAHVAARVRRQERLTEETNPLQLATVISEAALLRTLGHRDIAAGQFRHLIDMAKRDNIDIRVLPCAAGIHPSMSGSFAIMTFQAGISPDVGYQEYAVGGHLVDDADAVASLHTIWEALHAQALNADESLELITEMASRAGNEAPRDH